MIEQNWENTQEIQCSKTPTKLFVRPETVTRLDLLKAA